MRGRILVQEAEGLTPSEMEVEIVERKGLGHPDTLCDLLMEQVSQALCRAYRERFGRILHHNCDKGLLAAGQVSRRLGGGKVLRPMRLVIGDRAADTVGKKKLDVAGVAVGAVQTWLKTHLPRIDPDRHLRYQVELKPGSEELSGIFAKEKEVLGANDTSAAVGYAPLSATEQLVLETEHYLNSPGFKARFPGTGEDVKVMGVRSGGEVALTVAMPFLDSHIENEADYFRRKEAVQEALRGHLSGRLEGLEGFTIHLNNLDRRGLGMDGMYLSVLGTSAEDSDSGQVGRGNQVNGLIALNRPRSSEAAAGKNPLSHIGKIYNILAHVLAGRLQARVPGIREAALWLYARIGEPIDRPQIVSVQVHLRRGAALADVEGPVRQLIEEQLARMPAFCEELSQGRYAVC